MLQPLYVHTGKMKLVFRRQCTYIFLLVEYVCQIHQAQLTGAALFLFLLQANLSV